MLRIRTLLLFGLAAVSLGASGCIIGDTDNSAMIVDWDLRYVGPDERTQGDRVACEDAGTTTVELEMRNRSTNAVFKDSYQCKDFGGKSKVLPSGLYDVRIALKTAGGQEISAQQVQAEVVRRGLTDLGLVIFQVQSFELTWTVSRGNMATMCDKVDGKDVKLIAQLANEPSKSYLFPCSDHGGVTTAILTGPYNLQVQLLNSAGAVISTTAPMPFLVSGSRRAVLPIVDFSVN
jgi:hypothetical protein